MGRKIWPNYYVGSSLTDEVNWLKNWIQGRLTWLDAQMTLFGSPILGNELEETQDMVYPNPSRGLFYWKFSLEKSSTVNYQVLDNQGRVLISSKSLNFEAGEQIYPLDLSSLPSSAYILQWTTGEGSWQKIRLNVSN
jgi:hypothetical protein